MILTITLVLSFLIITNLFLLKFSCNKISKPNNKKPVVLKPDTTSLQDSETLAPTGS